MRLYSLYRLFFIFSLLAAFSACGGGTEPPADTSTDLGTDTLEDTGPEVDTDTDSSDPGADVDEDILVQTDDGVASSCTSNCDCAQGEACISGSCALTEEAVLCCENDGCTEGLACSNADGSAGLCGVETSPLYGKVVINEVLTDGTTDGDPNQDGEASNAVGDEFVELLNVSDESLSLAGATVVEKNLNALPRHTFSSERMIEPGKAIVIFGGGTAPDDTESSAFVVANAADPGIALGLHLDDDGDDLRVLDKDGLLIAAFSYGPNQAIEAQSDQSLTRNPDGTGDFTPHTEASGDEERIFSPGTRVDGSSF